MRGRSASWPLSSLGPSALGPSALIPSALASRSISSRVISSRLSTHGPSALRLSALRLYLVSTQLSQLLVYQLTVPHLSVTRSISSRVWLGQSILLCPHGKRTSCTALGRSGESIPTCSISEGNEDSEERQRGVGQRPNTSHARWAGTVKGKAQCRAVPREIRCLDRFPQDIMHLEQRRRPEARSDLTRQREQTDKRMAVPE